ncbi:hypothetical protein QCE73_04840 [Caballeronia sp. LZ029]|uniref:hypothetical protein n=1 Tax=Caballeronia sp. LZ029 TaxID=3038564 RepID=UPI0028557B7C|nr:hypothetical protein [Caballeronia sp. LZ029]MDR5742481.1 hypothetical protein [Caballeronia sp. LZ029]
MGYVTMDHAKWAEDDIRAAKKREQKDHPLKRRRDVTKGYRAAPDTLSPFQRNVFNILGMVGNGIYNAPIAWDAIRWKGWGHGIAIPWKNDLATWDFNGLTNLVFLSHEARIRVEIRPNGFHGLLLCFWPRVAKGSMCERHPNLAEAVAAFRDYLGENHSIVYRETRDEAAKEAA